MLVTVYSPSEPCNACRQTKRRLESLGVPFDEVTAGVEDVARFRGEGHSAFPVVVVELGEGASWAFSGYRHADLARLGELAGSD